MVVLIVASGSDESGSTSSDVVNWIKLLFGLLFLVLAAKQWTGRPRGPASNRPRRNGWRRSTGFTAGKSLGLGALLSGVNPKNLALTLASAASIAQAGLSTGQSAIAVTVFIVIGSVTVAGPVLFFVIAPSRAAAPLATIKDFMSDHNAVIMMVVLLLLGAKLIGAGIAGLTN